MAAALPPRGDAEALVARGVERRWARPVAPLSDAQAAVREETPRRWRHTNQAASGPWGCDAEQARKKGNRTRCARGAQHRRPDRQRRRYAQRPPARVASWAERPTGGRGAMLLARI